MFKLFKKQNNSLPNQTKSAPSYMTKSVFCGMGAPSWYNTNYSGLSSEAYSKNVIAYRCISMIARQASYIPIKAFNIKNQQRTEILNTNIADILKKPNSKQSYSAFVEQVYSYLLISGNAYILCKKSKNNSIISLEALRPDRISIISDSSSNVIGYKYKINNTSQVYNVNPITSKCDILQIKLFNPLNDFYGLSPLEAARFAIDQHNESSIYNKSLLQNSARPSGALVVNSSDVNKDGVLSDEQFYRLKDQIENQFSNTNAGRPILLEGGLDWKEMSISPKDMDFIENRNTSAREIALALGVAPQIIGIPGDATYNNMSEARLSLWEQTIIPLINLITTSFEEWLKLHISEDFELEFDKDAISTLSSQRDSEMEKLSRIDFLTKNEKRRAIGLNDITGGDVLQG